MARRYSQSTQLIGAVIVNTTTTAKPIPTDASIFFDIARNEHNPKKLPKESSTLEIFIQLTKKMLNQEFDTSKLLTLIENPENIRNYYVDYFGLYKLLEDSSYLGNAYQDVLRKSEGFKEEFKEIYFNYPLQKEILDEYKNVLEFQSS